MRWAERGTFVAGLLLAGYAIADTPTYGKVETFQPGKKYNCVPTADRKGWDCSESGKAEGAPTQQTGTPSPPPAAQAPAQDVTPSTPPPAAEAPPKASALPGYLMNSAAGNRPASVTPPSEPKAEPVPEPVAPAESKPEAKAPEQTPLPAPKAASPAPTASAPAEPKPEAEAPQQSPPPAPAESQPRAPGARPLAPATPAPSPGDFLALPSDQYVVELARADSAGELAEPAVPSGKVYKLHLRQNGGGSWLLLWGPFASVETARTARNEIAAQGLTSGWPRPIGPLQAEARRASE